ncbi:MAG: mechanosensitive ion channel [Piscinibacter sp.]|nr:mechanosensitive ion channel [Piscinibacter sp.]
MTSRRARVAVAADFSSSRWLWLALPALWLAFALAPLRAAEATATGPAAPLSPASGAALAPAQDVATLSVFNRPIVNFHVDLPGLPPKVRVERAHTEIMRVLQAGGPDEVTSVTIPLGTMIVIDDVGVFALVKGDLVGGQTIDGVVAALRVAVSEGREARSLTAMLKASGFALIGTAVFALVIWGLVRLRRRLRAALVALGHRHSQRLAVGGRALISGERVFDLARAATTLVHYGLVLAASGQWLSFVLQRYPYTRRWGEELNDSGLRLASKFLAAVVDSLPGLAVAIVIFFLARGVLGLVRPFFNQVERGELTLPWIDRYTVRATRGLVHIGIWLFALAMAYPYLPGSDTEAFKGITVLLGVMLSLGSSNFVGQAMSGLILTYSRTLHVGEYVRIAEVEGTVTEMGTFATRIRTGLGEELTLPNTMIVGTVTKNYSRTVKGNGYIVDTVLTIGYDTPWRQVHAMMIEAARRTEGILASPAPHVFQTALSDFYVEYRLVAQAVASAPRPRAQVLADLHGHLQDVFNENGVQIMSPHYLGDPSQAKIVAPAQWNPPLTPAP